MLLSQNVNQVFPEAHESQEKTFCGVLGCFRLVPKACLISPAQVLHWPDLIYFSRAALSFYAGANLWEESGRTVWKAPVWVARQGAVAPYQIKDLANDHRTAKRALGVCTWLEKLTQALSEVVQMQRIKSGVCTWTSPQLWEPHSTYVLKAFKSQTLFLLHV